MKSSVKPRDGSQIAITIRDNGKGYGLPIDEMTWVVGPELTFDPKTERFSGERADEANKLLRRDYRAPFVVPETV